MKISDSIRYVGVNDNKVDLFEGQYRVLKGMSYNSYVILDEKIAVFDTVELAFSHEWLKNVERELSGRKPDYLILQHMEPDHSASIPAFLAKYPDVKIVSGKKAFEMLLQFFPSLSEVLSAEDRRITIQNDSILELGVHSLRFIAAPMVHWPEVMMTYEEKEKIFFSADAFGKFGAVQEREETPEEWTEEARRYYIGIVGKYGLQVQNVLKKAVSLEIQAICPLHGPVLRENLEYYTGLYDIWSSYQPENSGVVIAYASAYGYTREAALYLAELLEKKEIRVIVHDLARDDMSEVVAHAFQYDKLVLASSTYNGGVFPFMQQFLLKLLERSFKNRRIGIIENGSWAPMAAKTIKGMLEGSRDITYTETTVTIMSALKEENKAELRMLAEELA